MLGYLCQAGLNSAVRSTFAGITAPIFRPCTHICEVYTILCIAESGTLFESSIWCHRDLDKVHTAKNRRTWHSTLPCSATQCNIMLLLSMCARIKLQLSACSPVTFKQILSTPTSSGALLLWLSRSQQSHCCCCEQPASASSVIAAALQMFLASSMLHCRCQSLLLLCRSHLCHSCCSLVCRA